MQFFVSAMHFLLNIWDVLLPIGADDCTKSVEVIEIDMSLKTDQAIIRVETVRQSSQFGSCILGWSEKHLFLERAKWPCLKSCLMVPKHCIRNLSSICEV